jgi:hypothetical protein
MGDWEKKTVVIQLGNEAVEFELFSDKAPNICEAIWSRLPLESFVTPAKVCSSEIIFMLPFVVEGENMEWPKIGDIGWWAKRSSVNIWYNDAGPLGPLGPTALFGRVTKNLGGIEREAQITWANPGMRIFLSKKRA